MAQLAHMALRLRVQIIELARRRGKGDQNS